MQDKIFGLITGTLGTIRKWVGLVLPVFAKASDFRSWSPWVWRILHLLLLIGVLALMWWLNLKLEVPRFLQAVPEYLRQFFLPVLFLLVYALSWLGYWLWRLMAEEEEAADFPDVDAAWNEAVRKLESAGIGLADAPLFLIVGKTAAGDDALFQASQVATTLRAPAAADAPLRVYAHRDAIYVTCPGASAWARLAAAAAGEVESEDAAGPAALPIDKTMKFDESIGLAQEQLDEMKQLLTVRSERDLTPKEQGRLQELTDLTKQPKAVAKRVRLSGEEQARGTARLRFLCRLIRRDRSPWCPANGVLLLMPWSATESDEVVKEAVTILQRELTAVRGALQLRCPVYALVCDLETARGFKEFRDSLPATMLKSRVGQRVPLAPDLAAGEVSAVWERAVQWIGQSVLPVGILKFLRQDGAADEARKSGPKFGGHNRNLYLLLREVYMRGPRLARVLSRGLAAGPDAADEPDALPLFGGCYLAGTGRQAHEQAFVPGVFQRLLDGQNSVSWTSQALTEDARYRKWTTLGYAVIALVVLGAVLLGGWLWQSQRPGAGGGLTLSPTAGTTREASS